MKYYESAVIKGLDYSQALRFMEEGLSVSREEWDGLHFIKNGTYYILLKSGEIIREPEEVYNKDSKDWCIVVPNSEAIKVIKEYFNY